jgi:hypothetical protein
MKNVSLFATFFFRKYTVRESPTVVVLNISKKAVLNIIRNKHDSFLSVLKSGAVPKMFQNADYKH